MFNRWHLSSPLSSIGKRYRTQGGRANWRLPDLNEPSLSRTHPVDKSEWMEKWSVVIAVNASGSAASAASEKRRSIGWRARREGVRGLESIGISSAHFVAVVDSIPRVVAIEQSRAGELSSRGFEGGTPCLFPSLSLFLSLFLPSLSLPLSCPPSTTDSKIVVVVRCLCERGTRVRHVIACTPVLSAIFLFPPSPLPLAPITNETPVNFVEEVSSSRRKGGELRPGSTDNSREEGKSTKKALGTRRILARLQPSFSSSTTTTTFDVGCRADREVCRCYFQVVRIAHNRATQICRSREEIASLQASRGGGLPSPPAGSVVVSSTRESHSQTRTFPSCLTAARRTID